MKRTILAGLLAAAALPIFAQNARQEFDLFGGSSWGSALEFSGEGMALKVSGTAGTNAAGYMIESRENLEFSGRSRLIVKVSGVQGEFDSLKLLKLDLNDRAQTTISGEIRNYNDPLYINAQDGEAVFDISRLRNIRKINLVFYNCTIEDLKVEVFYE